MLDIIKELGANKTVIDACCGIGSISKALIDSPINVVGFDKCPMMVGLANENYGRDKFFQGDILDTNNILSHSTHLTVTHGALEHFQDDDIIKICKNMKNSIHYVPLDGYVTPSFGDERLLPKEYWVDLVNPLYYTTFNEGKDLVFLLGE